MKVSTGQLARRYATALVENAIENRQIDALALEAQALLNVISSELEAFFASPTRTADEKNSMLQLLIEKLKLSEFTARGLHLMAQNNRLMHVKAVFKKILEFVDAHKNVIRAQVKTATPLTPSESAELEKVLSQSVGRTVLLECETEPQLRAGMVVKLGTRQIDSSLKTRLTNLKEILSQGV
ncbi:MAG: hypothetical protein RIR26_22 [Pseudomonadota bacterium]|jgi:F-type H+-transporting ATPase subunit delta